MIPRQYPDGPQQVEQLLLALYDGFTHDTGSCAVISEILEALVKTPDGRALDALVMIEAQVIDRDSPLCPPRLPRDVITYYDPDDDSLHRAVPRDIHLNLFAALERISVRLHDREELVTARLEQYRRLIIEAEIDRIMPALVNLLQEYEENAVISPGAYQRASQGMPASDDPVMNPAAGCEMPETDYVAVLMKMETELREYLMGTKHME